MVVWLPSKVFTKRKLAIPTLLLAQDPHAQELFVHPTIGKVVKLAKNVNKH